MLFGEVEEVSGAAFYTSDMCGILGLGYGTISYKHVPTFIESSSLEDKSFSFYLHENPQESFMVVPGYDDTLMNDIQYHDVVEKGYWSLNLSGMKRGN